MPIGPHTVCETKASLRCRGLLVISVLRERHRKLEVTFCKETDAWPMAQGKLLQEMQMALRFGTEQAKPQSLLCGQMKWWLRSLLFL